MSLKAVRDEGFSWLKTGFMAGSCEHDDESSDFIKNGIFGKMTKQ
jgi:hypothetical protein